MLPKDLKHQIRKIRGTEITHADIQALLPSESQRKITGTSINAYGACTEDMHEDRDFCIFNSWIAPIASGQVKSGIAYGTIHGHIHASAYTDTSLDELLARPRWAFPLCGGKPQHWVLGIIDFTRNEIAVFDSIPELNSMNEWAENMLVKAVNAVMACLGKPVLEWSPVYWKRKVYSPLEYHGQIDGWSCGLFVMMAIDVFVDNGSYDSVTDDKKDAMKNKALETLMTLPVIRVSKKATCDSEDDEPVEIVNQTKASTALFPTTSNELIPAEVQKVSHASFPDSKILGKRSVNGSKETDDASDGSNTDDEKRLKKRSKATSGARGAKILLSQ
ncbi:uncharacterized protein F5147DRAFT_815686 [Suillus discolor]|uniref:Ubiquitin-like protease family profile domain-containing protein n=1 Tax=Suillus discolor TaxID=1912936 RepID=A0A9P7EYU4_9AGAM|nr:uncharacterized protein F5147DRAFT_815686 [Suillus discolor]KAG2098733.1 hypothetical protein F5147DRAFT_815686 [Suillus discolor]